MPISIRDVARRAGVTISTVSRVFNQYPDVMPATREKVMRAAQELNYEPNANARSLSSKRPPNLCMIFSGLEDGDPRDAMLSQTLKGIIQYTTEHHLELSIYSTDSQEQSRQSFTQFCAHHAISGAIVSGVKTDDPYFVELMDSGIPVVGIDIPLEGETAGWISIDNRKASEEAVEMLFATGHRELLIVAGSRVAAVNETRLSGVQDAFRKAGFPLEEERILYADFQEEQAFRKASLYLRTHPLPDAVFCFSDIMALGVMKACREQSIRIPEDLSLMGFDGMPFCTLTTPTLSTVRQDQVAFGYTAAGLVDDLMHDRKDAERYRLIPYQLEFRESVRSRSL